MNDQLPARRPTGPRFVAPEAAQPIRAYPVAPVEEAEYAHPAPAQAEIVLRPTYKDHADGFIRAVTPLAADAGAAKLVAAVGRL